MAGISKHVVIIGGGLAGLTAAAYLGRSGCRVTLFERSDALGGRGTSVERNGYTHNFGPHALYGGGAGVEVLDDLGIEYTGGSPEVSGVAVRGGKTYTLPTSARTMLATRLFGVRARVEAGRQLLALRKPHDSDERTVAQWLDEELHEVAARDYIRALIRLATYANAPELTSLKDAGRQFAATGSGVLYLDGGWRTLTEGLRRRAEDTGTEVRTNARVASVSRNGDGWAVRLEGGSVVAAEAVVLAVPPSGAYELCPESTTLARFAEEAIPARAACLDVGLRRLPNPRRRFGLGIDVPLYLSVHTAYAKLAPEGRVMVSVAKYIPAGEAPDAKRDLAELEGFLDTVQPGWREMEEHRQHLPNMVVSSAIPRAGLGGITGRPGTEVRGSDGLFVAGDWVGTGGWLADGTLASGRSAAAAVSRWLATSPEAALAHAVR